MLLPSIECCSSHLGISLHAKQSIPKGTVVWLPCSDCQHISKTDLQTMSKTERAFYDEKGYYLASGGILLPCHNACYMNHSCEANVLNFGLDFGIAVRDIIPNSQVYCEYRNWDYDPNWSMICRCGSVNCQKKITPLQGKSSTLQKHWFNQIKQALSCILQVEQPLEGILGKCSKVYRLIKSGRFKYEQPSSYSIFQQS